ncbi:MAG TPA: hypothetical protein VGI68_13595 [Mycobacterium sp.]|jgi:hypothetical protein
MPSRNEPAARFVAALAELFFRDELHEPLEQTLDRLVSPTFAQRINGHVYQRNDYLDHVRDMRGTVNGGEVAVIEQLQIGDRIAGRYLFRVTQPDSRPAQFESHIFAEFTEEGQISRMCEVARVVDDSDDTDLLPAG